MLEASLFSVVNVAVGFGVSLVLTYYILPLFFGVPRSVSKSFAITAIYTGAALARNVLVYWGFQL